ncbi:hypothetical protein [Streptomyces sp. NPDC058758]|uniref:hypothetical protein n=1 Tax=Streptomyces sp. NPDC058758 TaxID=3346627 RepID=UPI003683AB45
MPGVLLAGLAVQAAGTLVPDLPVRSVDDLAFSAWVRVRADGRPSRFRVDARRTDSRHARAVTVTVHSETVALDGRALARNREHFRATDQCRTTPLGTTARRLPDARDLAGLPRLGTPCTLLDGLARTPALRAAPDGRRPVPVPHRIERIALYEPGDDRAFLASHPDGLRLHHSPATAVSTATARDGRVVAQITGMRATVLAHLPAGPVTPPPAG